jgi:hypothetical protein
VAKERQEAFRPRFEELVRGLREKIPVKVHGPAPGGEAPPPVSGGGEGRR